MTNLSMPMTMSKWCSSYFGTVPKVPIAIGSTLACLCHSHSIFIFIHGLLGCSPALKRNHSARLDWDVFQALAPEENKENEHFEFKKPTRPASRGSLHFSSLDDEKDPLEEEQDLNTALMVLIERTSGGTTQELHNIHFHHSWCFVPPHPFPPHFCLQNDAETPSDMSCLWTSPLVVTTSEDLLQSPPFSPPLRGGFSPKSKGLGHSSGEHRSKLRTIVDFGLSLKKPKPEAIIPPSSLIFSQFNNRLLFAACARWCVCLGVCVFGCVCCLIFFVMPLQGYLFHTVDGKHQDLKYIDPEMIVAVLNGSFSVFITQCVIIDCRFPYEYAGGHIKGAVNLPMEQDVEDFLLKKPLVSSGNKRIIVVFHCEFSSEPCSPAFADLGPGLAHSVSQPTITQSSTILQRGYKDFFLKSYCEPQSYRPMHHKDFKEDLRTFRTRSRTWAGEKSKREHYSRLKKL
uniref:protein-tyrosine-phosphatase n=1 Tax=Laticauda laticaudata TaxID=8630 RepID=A0A8C5SMJ6_LATLA